MALLALEEVFTIGSKFAPVIWDALFTSTAVGSTLSSGRSSVPVQSNPPNIPSATPGGTDATLQNRLNAAGIDPAGVATIANAPVAPPPPPDPGSGVPNPPTSVRTFPLPFRPTRAYFEEKNGTNTITQEQTDILIQNELRLMAEFFQTTPEAIGSIREFGAVAANAVTGEGPVFSYHYGQQLARDMVFIMNAERSITDAAASSPQLSHALDQARSDYELKLGGPISPQNFVRTLAARGVSGPRIARAWSRVNGPRGDNPATRAIFRRWVTDRLLPGAAGSAVTYLMERIMGSSVPQESRNVNSKVQDDNQPPAVDWERSRNDLLDNELRSALGALNVGDEASNVIGSRSWDFRLTPLPGSVQWTPNTTSASGMNDDKPFPIRMPTSSPDVITYPGDAIYNRGLNGDMLSERTDDARAAYGPGYLNLPMPPTPKRTSVAPYLVVPENRKDGLGIRAVHSVNPYFHFPAIHETARRTDHMVSQTYDPTMVANLPSFVTPVTSSAGNLYGRDQRAYRNALDSAPNITGVGFDVSDTERRLVEAVAMSDDTMTTPPSAFFQNDQQTMAERNKEVPYVPPSNQRNPVFANVGVQQPVAPIQPLSVQRPL